jgi:hypothetical protein
LHDEKTIMATAVTARTARSRALVPLLRRRAMIEGTRWRNLVLLYFVCAKNSSLGVRE